jgi:hypothetical protein
MSLREMKDGVHDALWNAQQQWFELRDQGETKHSLKMAGLRDAKDPNHYTRGLIFTGRTRTTYERDLRDFVKFCHERFGVQHLRDVTVDHARAYLERGINQGWAAKTLHKLRSELVKLAATALHKTASFVALSKEYGRIIRGLASAKVVAGPTRQTPAPEVVARAVEILRERDAKHPGRAYHLVAKLQLATAARSISGTERVGLHSLQDGNRIEIVGKGGKVQTFVISAALHAKLKEHLTAHPGPLASRDGYRHAWRHAVETAGGRVGGTHGLRRLSTQEFYRERYQARLRGGETTAQARAGARKDAVERLGHGRDRVDQANGYLGESA